MAEKMLRPGKLPNDLLARMLAKYAPPGEGVVVGPGIGVDAAVIDAGMPGEYLIAKTDPITFLASDIGRYAIIINANDVACMGGKPRWFSACVILPEGATEALAEEIFGSLSSACKELGVSLVGGHTEITHGLDRPLVVGHMLGTVGKDKLITAAGARPGDALILTKGIAIEAVSVIARVREAELVNKFGARFAARCSDYFRDPGISVLKDAETATGAGAVHAMHDPTEGGLSGGLYELAEASGTGIEVIAENIRVLPEAERLLGHLSLDPLGSIASGALLVAAPPADAENIVSALEGEGIGASVIGAFTEEKGVRLVRAGRAEKFPRFAADELTKLFGDFKTAP